MRLWILATLLAASLSAQTWAKGEIGFRLTIIPAGCPAERAGLRIGDILAEPAGVRTVLNGSGILPVYRFDSAKAAYAKQDVRISFEGGEERRLGVTGDLGFLINALSPETPSGLLIHDFLPKIDDRFVHEIPDLTLPKDRAAAIHVTRWDKQKRDFVKAIVTFKP